MAQIVTITNPLTGQPAQVDQLEHTAQQIDDGLNIARGVSNPNLLDNWYFGNPVNQRNVSETIDTVGYFLDRWKLVSGSVTIGSNGITLNGTIVQILETAAGAGVTASALTTEGVVDASYDNSSKTFSLTGTGQTFVAAKLELGDQQTLAHQDANGNWVLNEIPDYGEQLLRCQRYFVNLNINKAPYFAMPIAIANKTTQAQSCIALSVPMRTQPTVSYGGTFFLSNISSDYTVTNIKISSNTFSGMTFQMDYDVNSGLTVGSIYRAQGGNDFSSYIWLSADL